MNLLFICNQNENRSKTAEALFRNEFKVKSAGLYNETPVSKEQMQWADTIIVMEPEQRAELSKRFPQQYLEKRIISIDIPDIYAFNQPELVDQLKKKLGNVLKPVA